MFRTGELISPRGTGNNKELFEVVYMDRNYVQAVNIKQNGFISIPRAATSGYRHATDADVQSFMSRYLKYFMIQNYSESGAFKVDPSYIDRL